MVERCNLVLLMGCGWVTYLGSGDFKVNNARVCIWEKMYVEARDKCYWDDEN